MASPEDCAALVMEVVPPIMRAIRGEMRQQGRPELTVPQLRTLLFLSRRKAASLSQVAEHIGIMLPSASRLVDGLVDRGLVRRAPSREDRRRVVLDATARGLRLTEAVRRGAQARMADRLAALSPEARAALVRGLEGVRPLVVAPPGGGR